MKKLALFILTLIILSSCKKDVFFNDNYSFLYGNWTPTQLSAGLNYNADPRSIGDIVQFFNDGSYKIIKKDYVVESGRINIEVQTEDKLTLSFVPSEIDFSDDSFIRLSRSSLIVTIFTNDSISLGNLATDGGYFGLWLTKKE